jgi:hypothetical protein
MVLHDRDFTRLDRATERICCYRELSAEELHFSTKVFLAPDFNSRNGNEIV